MPHRRSYADPVIGGITIALRQDRDPALLALLGRHPLGASNTSGLIADLAEQTLLNMPGTFVHEWSHILQIAAYPLLYLRAARVSLLLGLKWKYLAENPGTYPLPLRLQVGRNLTDSRLVEKNPMRIYIDLPRVQVQPATPGRVRRGTVSENDLVEEDASIVQYRIETGGWGSGADYRRWISRRSSYTAVFSFLTRYVSDETAYALIPIAARLAFRTTRPLEALAIILGVALREGMDGESIRADEKYSEFILQLFLDQSFEPVDGRSVSLQQLTIDDSRGAITDEQHRETVGKTTHMPINPMARWNLGDDSATAFLREPWRYVSSSGVLLSDDAVRYFPPAVIFELENPARLAISINRRVGSIPLGPGSKLTVADAIPEVLQLKLLLDVELGDRAPLRVCPHEACVYHGKNLCDGYFPVPRRKEDCRFPMMFESASGHTVSPTGDTLQPKTIDRQGV
jgi:hypothetical protein